jgi:hypothetical protein
MISLRLQHYETCSERSSARRFYITHDAAIFAVVKIQPVLSEKGDAIVAGDNEKLLYVKNGSKKKSYLTQILIITCINLTTSFDLGVLQLLDNPL